MNGTKDKIWRRPIVIIIAGCLIAVIGFGARSVLGLFLEPMTVARGWDRETFALALAIQNLMWGLCMPLAGAIADRHGPMRVIAAGAMIYAAGIWGMAQSTAPLALHIFGGLLTGLGVAFTGFSLALAAMARVVGPEKAFTGFRIRYRCRFHGAGFLFTNQSGLHYGLRVAFFSYAPGCIFPASHSAGFCSTGG